MQRITRVLGYKFVTRTATEEEVASWVETATQQGWQIPADLTHAVFSSFDGEGEELPFELRGSCMTIRDRMPLIWAHDAITNFSERVSYAAEKHDALCKCDNCAATLAMLDREYGVLRGNMWRQPNVRFV